MTDIKSKILIIEDDLDVAEMLNAYFRVQGYDVFTVNWGEDGVRSCQTIHPDLVILDIRLPDIDGYEVARRLRGDRRTSEVPIIFLTEKRDRSDRLQGLEIGADDYITKPFDVQELRLRVRNALKRVSQGSLTNPVTGLPEGALVDEKLSEVVGKDGIAALFVSIENMDSFREAYGFVASDDVLRAISLMIVNTMRETSRPEDFLGHVTTTDFILVIPPSNLAALSEKLRARLEQSVEYFYPIKDREQMVNSKNRLGVKLAELSSLKDKFADANQVKAELVRLKK
ncbi:MAG: response regulator [Anaerolineales bacterium]|uniref:GGDEF domain-containing response regulator n=1 Tax=Candidatus Villigracilis affinis TaxID=3140682 RepID=UPI001DE614EC|nr:response regulator [Anaerolineales bacterium]MBK9600789.1 response regulator [Anaerolineales bacterium]MBL0344520.1 response regulator [Anaerolineales bacterium]